MELLKTVGRAIRKGLEELDKPSAAPVEPTVDPGLAVPIHPALTERIQQLEVELSFYKRRSQEYFGCIRDFEQQRDQWRELYKRDSAGHQQAQAVLQEACIQARQQLVRAVQMLNVYRAEKKEPPITDVAELEGKVRAFPVGLVEEMKKQADADVAEMPAPVNSEVVVSALVARSPAPEGVVDQSQDPVPTS